MLQYSEFFSNLSHRVESARQLERELDRQLARRFNIFDYLSTDELGLSRVLADLLNPDAFHGQGGYFLERFLALLSESMGVPRKLDMARSHVYVEVEKLIPELRRIDVFVQLGEGNDAYALAIENKPFAGDQANQLHDYLKYLDERFHHNYTLLYLSPNGEGPSECSVRLEELRENWSDRFGILAYCTTSVFLREDQYAPFRISNFTLINWLQTCQRECEVDRLRWFVGDLAKYCQREFGD
ncbi:MAG: PD-(D/E)XK nuclease family protein [Gammaproteobacteria bacterium]|nr:PD-(D/E)XK nuclease family protein [Gammaproteobacteria bacterium]